MKAEKLLSAMRRYAESQGFEINPDEKIVDFVIQGLLRNEEKFGYRYCPCRVLTGDKRQDARIICPCVYHRGEIESMGRCHCGLFVAKAGREKPQRWVLGILGRAAGWLESTNPLGRWIKHQSMKKV